MTNFAILFLCIGPGGDRKWIWKILFQNNPFLVAVIVGFNVKLSKWYYRDKSSSKGNAVDTITKWYGLHKDIKETTHISEHSSTCINLIFTSQSNLIIEPSVHPSLHPNCHHQIAYVKFNLQIHFPPPNSPKFWHHKDAKTKPTIRSIEKLNWQRVSLNTSVNEKVVIFNKTMLNILSNLFLVKQSYALTKIHHHDSIRRWKHYFIIIRR